MFVVIVCRTDTDTFDMRTKLTLYPWKVSNTTTMKEGCGSNPGTLPTNLLLFHVVSSLLSLAPTVWDEELALPYQVNEDPNLDFAPMVGLKILHQNLGM